MQDISLQLPKSTFDVSDPNIIGTDPTTNGLQNFSVM